MHELTVAHWGSPHLTTVLGSIYNLTICRWNKPPGLITKTPKFLVCNYPYTNVRMVIDFELLMSGDAFRLKLVLCNLKSLLGGRFLLCKHWLHKLSNHPTLTKCTHVLSWVSYMALLDWHLGFLAVFFNPCNIYQVLFETYMGHKY